MHDQSHIYIDFSNPNNFFKGDGIYLRLVVDCSYGGHQYSSCRSYFYVLSTIWPGELKNEREGEYNIIISRNHINDAHDTYLIELISLINTPPNSSPHSLRNRGINLQDFSYSPSIS